MIIPLFLSVTLTDKNKVIPLRLILWILNN